MPAAHPLSLSVHANQLGAVDEVCGATLGCAQSDVFGQLLLLIITGLLAVFVLAAIQHVRNARGAVREERSRTATEQHAFSRFAREVARIDAASSSVQLAPASGAASAVSVPGGPPPDRGLEQVRAAYEETVMAMAHYEEEYDEPLVHHMREEFGDEIATAMIDGHRLSPQLKQALLQRSVEAANDRERLISRLDREADSLDEAAEEFRSLDAAIDRPDGPLLGDRTFRELVDEWHRLGEVESRLRRLLSRRQELLQSSGTGHHRDGPSLQDYLYSSLDATYPVLADGSSLAGRVKGAQSRVLDALTRRA